MSFLASKKSFLKNGNPHFLISGEIHYFRIEPRLWRKHLLLLKDAGANTTSTYIPWEWHGVEEGRYDFSGETHPARNLIGYIELCGKVGLDLIVKPGPYILAEYVSHGLPAWLLERCSSAARARDESGNVIADDIMTYMSEEFLEQTFRWYDQVLPLIARYQESKGGPIIMMQVCNEVGVFQWLSGKTDHSQHVVRFYRQFLRQKYGTIESLNRMHGSRYAAFEDPLPPCGQIGNRDEYRAYVDFHLFYRHYYALYLDTLIRKIRGAGVGVQLSHNIPGWIFGNAEELPMLASTYAEVMRTRNDLVFGLDHIPEFASFRNAHSDLACNKILEAMQPQGPVWAAEFQAGTREQFVKNDARDMELFYFASLSHGLKGFNYYMFSQGTNPKGKGFYGPSFYYQTPLDTRGTKSALYGAAKKLDRFIRREKDHLLACDTAAWVCVGLYQPYFYTELTTSRLLREKALRVEQLGLRLDPRYVRETLFFNGLLRALQTLNIPYDVRDLELASVEDLLRYRQLWFASTEFMGAETQRLLAAYVKKGGHLVITPAIPTLDDYLLDCRILEKELGIEARWESSPQKICAFGVDEMFTQLREKQVFRAPEREVVARTDAGDACGIHRSIERGRLTALGFAVGYSTDDHLRFYERVLALDRISREVRISDPDIQFVVRRGKERSYLFLLNYHNTRKTFTIGRTKETLGPYSYKVLRKK